MIVPGSETQSNRYLSGFRTHALSPQWGPVRANREQDLQVVGPSLGDPGMNTWNNSGLSYTATEGLRREIPKHFHPESNLSSTSTTHPDDDYPGLSYDNERYRAVSFEFFCLYLFVTASFLACVPPGWALIVPARFVPPSSWRR